MSYPDNRMQSKLEKEKPKQLERSSGDGYGHHGGRGAGMYGSDGNSNNNGGDGNCEPTYSVQGAARKYLKEYPNLRADAIMDKLLAEGYDLNSRMPMFLLDALDDSIRTEYFPSCAFG